MNGNNRIFIKRNDNNKKNIFDFLFAFFKIKKQFVKKIQ